MKKYVRIAAGGIVLAVGVLGLMLPILPGWLLIGVAMLLLSPHVPICRRGLDEMERRLPFGQASLHHLRRWLG